MKSLLITILLIAVLNIPVFLELYKHVLKSKAVWIRIIISIVYWGIALATQNIAAFAGILYLYVVHYRHIRTEEHSDDTDTWHISGLNAAIALLLAAVARIAMLIVHYVYIIILVELVKYNIKPQDIVSYYSESQYALKLILALTIIIVAPVVEEFVFRYFLYDKVLGPRMPLAVAAIFSAALFTVLHFNISVVPTLFGLGLVCTYLYQKKGYWAAVIAHAVNNLITLVYISFF